MIAVPDADREVGMEAYSSKGPPCAARMKAFDEDFRVEEFISADGMTAEPREGYLPLYRVEKRSIDTMHLERELSVALKSRVSFGGLKDKRAVAVQYATPTSRNSGRPDSVSGERWTAKVVGFVPSPISRSSVAGNRFQLVLRDCCAEIEERFAEAFELSSKGLMPNFYGMQRFGVGAGTHRVGRAMIRRDYAGAVRVMLCEPRARDGAERLAAREAMAAGKYEEGARLLPQGQDTERRVAFRLASKPEDWVGALRAIPVRLRRLYAQAYQSYLFNRTLSEALRAELDISQFEKGDNWCEVGDDGLVLSRVRGVRDGATGNALPMVQLAGFAYRNYGSRFDRCLEKVLAEEGVSAKDFYLEEMQEVSFEGGFRIPHMLVRDQSVETSGDMASANFVLARGQYATVLLREVIKPRDPIGVGFG
ncbi:MAG: tRNA pseudouridine(13) synthase TruD [Thaumarchaeota archaeon]|nr:tRNA pseudouridine(13) synthase TruD [Nitrososphaerota archaeon]